VAECRSELKIEEGKKVICFVGNLVQWQGIEYLIKSMPLISKKRDDVSAIIVGDGILRRELEKLSLDLRTEDRIEFTGAVPYQKVPTYINASDVCVAPFTRKRNEKIGLSALKVYEYLACGKPVVASNIKGVGDFLAKTHTGVPFEPENESELAGALIELMADDNRMKEMGEKGRKLVIENYSWDSVAKQIAKILKGIRKEV
jgi:glycosyltransferase involved in cell wall biosynthesis